MKKSIRRWLIMVAAISLLVLSTAFATTIDGLLSEIRGQNSTTVTIADAQSFFGEYVVSKEVEIKDLITGTYYAYIPVDASAVVKYQASMEALGFIANNAELEDGVKQIIFDKGNARVLLIYSSEDFQLILCYQKDIDFVTAKAADINQIDKLIGSVKADITHTPMMTPAPTEKLEVGYVDVEIDGVQYHFSQVSSSKYGFMGESIWGLTFETRDNVRNDVKSTFVLETGSYIMPGDTFKPTSALETTFANSFYFVDRKGNLFTLNKFSNFTIIIDTMDEKGYEFTGRFNGTIYNSKSNEEKRVKNGTFKFVIHEGDDEEVSY